MHDGINIHNEVIFEDEGIRKVGKVIGFEDYITNDCYWAIVLCTDGNECLALTKKLTIINYNDG